ncbi:MAG TPA: glycosyltransferase family 2 protein [Ferruginibacter sp.]|nr:glycosyltransferase family 2 protein [Ferruginibacter sp.]
MEKVVAVVVTYNRAALLCNCIEALRKQTRPLDKILVINNGSTDETESWLLSQPDIECITQANVGGAGGFSRAIAESFAQGFTYTWCMDDDGFPKEDALEKLLAADDGHSLKLLNCIVVNKDDKDSLVWKTGKFTKHSDVDCDLIEGSVHPFNGTLINRRIVERVGIPKKKLFLWGDETEYLYRITRKNNIPAYTVSNSVHFHPKSGFTLKQDWDYQSGWKMYYYIRNRFEIYRSKFSNPVMAIGGYIAFLVSFFAVIVLFQKTDKLKKMQFAVKTSMDAFSQKFDTKPGDILTVLNTKPAPFFQPWNLIQSIVFGKREPATA